MDDVKSQDGTSNISLNSTTKNFNIVGASSIRDKELCNFQPRTISINIQSWLYVLNMVVLYLSTKR